LHEVLGSISSTAKFEKGKKESEQKIEDTEEFDDGC
jgi:hypothetical protein